MKECLRNRVKQARRKIKEDDPSRAPPPKKARESSTKDDLLRRYPVRSNDSSSTEDPASIAEHLKALDAEMAKDKPRDTTYLPLMSTLFSSQRSYVEDVKHILLVYPALRLPNVVSYNAHTVSQCHNIEI